jgi:hypothetical protein
MTTERQRFGLGGLLLIISTVLILGLTVVNSAIPSVFAGVAAIAMAAGSLLVGLSGDKATV